MHVCGSDKDFTWANCLALYFCVAFGCDWSSALESVGLRLLFARVSASPEREREVLYLTCHIQWFNTRYNINVDLRTYIFSRHNTVFLRPDPPNFRISWQFEHWPQSSFSLQPSHDPQRDLFLLSVMWMVHVNMSGYMYVYTNTFI